MYKYANTHENQKKTRKYLGLGKCLGNAENGNGCGRRTAMHGKTHKKKTKSVHTHKNVSRTEKKLWNWEKKRNTQTCENEKQNETYKIK